MLVEIFGYFLGDNVMFAAEIYALVGRLETGWLRPLMVDHSLLEPGPQQLRCSDHLACLCSLIYFVI